MVSNTRQGYATLPLFQGLKVPVRVGSWLVAVSRRKAAVHSRTSTVRAVKYSSELTFLLRFGARWLAVDKTVGARTYACFALNF